MSLLPSNATERLASSFTSTRTLTHSRSLPPPHSRVGHRSLFDHAPHCAAIDKVVATVTSFAEGIRLVTPPLALFASGVWKSAFVAVPLLAAGMCMLQYVDGYVAQVSCVSLFVKIDRTLFMPANDTDGRCTVVTTSRSYPHVFKVQRTGCILLSPLRLLGGFDSGRKWKLKRRSFNMIHLNVTGERRLYRLS